MKPNLDLADPGAVKATSTSDDVITDVARSSAERDYRGMLILVLAALAMTAIATIASRSWSISITFCDATLATDEGVVTVQIPLVKLAADQPLRNDIKVYHRGTNVWEHTSGARKSTHRNWMSLSDQDWFIGGSIAGFGYWRGDWQNDSRPGRFIVVFAPIWSIAVALFATVVLVHRYRVKWSLRLMLVMTVIAGLGLRLLTLRETVVN